MMTMAWAAVVGAIAGAGGAVAGDPALETARGGQVRLSQFRGKPSVLFYEARDSVTRNQPLKDALFARAKASKRLDAAQVVAVANVKGFDFFPAIFFVRKEIARLEEQFNIPILLDWHGAMLEKPWGLPDQEASVLILDAQGQRVFERHGALSAKDTEAFFRALSALIPEAP